MDGRPARGGGPVGRRRLRARGAAEARDRGRARARRRAPRRAPPPLLRGAPAPRDRAAARASGRDREDPPQARPRRGPCAARPRARRRPARLDGAARSRRRAGPGGNARPPLWSHRDASRLRVLWQQRSEWSEWARLTEGAYVLRTKRSRTRKKRVFRLSCGLAEEKKRGADGSNDWVGRRLAESGPGHALRPVDPTGRSFGMSRLERNGCRARAPFRNGGALAPTGQEKTGVPPLPP